MQKVIFIPYSSFKPLLTTQKFEIDNYLNHLGYSFVLYKSNPEEIPSDFGYETTQIMNIEDWQDFLIAHEICLYNSIFIFSDSYLMKNFYDYYYDNQPELMSKNILYIGIAPEEIDLKVRKIFNESIHKILTSNYYIFEKPVIPFDIFSFKDFVILLDPENLLSINEIETVKKKVEDKKYLFANKVNELFTENTDIPLDVMEIDALLQPFFSIMNIVEKYPLLMYAKPKGYGLRPFEVETIDISLDYLENIEKIPINEPKNLVQFGLSLKQQKDLEDITLTVKKNKDTEFQFELIKTLIKIGKFPKETSDKLFELFSPFKYPPKSELEFKGDSIIVWKNYVLKNNKHPEVKLSKMQMAIYKCFYEEKIEANTLQLDAIKEKILNQYNDLISEGNTRTPKDNMFDNKHRFTEFVSKIKKSFEDQLGTVAQYYIIAKRENEKYSIPCLFE